MLAFAIGAFVIGSICVIIGASNLRIGKDIAIGGVFYFLAACIICAFM